MGSNNSNTDNDITLIDTFPLPHNAKLYQLYVQQQDESKHCISKEMFDIIVYNYKRCMNSIHPNHTIVNDNDNNSNDTIIDDDDEEEEETEDANQDEEETLTENE